MYGGGYNNGYNNQQQQPGFQGGQQYGFQGGMGQQQPGYLQNAYQQQPQQGYNQGFQGGQGYSGFGMTGQVTDTVNNQFGYQQPQPGFQSQGSFGQPPMQGSFMQQPLQSQGTIYQQLGIGLTQPGFVQQPAFQQQQPGFQQQPSFPQQPAYPQQQNFQQQPTLQHQGSFPLQQQSTMPMQPSYIQQIPNQQGFNSQGLQSVMPGVQTALNNSMPSQNSYQAMVQNQNYNPEHDCDCLRKAMRGLGTDEDAIIKIICNRTNLQRQKIKTYYKTAFGKDLIKELKSELSGKFEDVVIGLFDTPSEYDANCLLKAMKGMGTDEDTLIEIIGTRNNTELNQIKKDFERLHKTNLVKYVESETSGRFLKLLVSLLQANRNESMMADQNQCMKWAQELYQAGEAKWGTDEAIFNKIFALRSAAEIKMVSMCYEQVSKKPLIKAIESEFSGDIKKLLITVINGLLNPSAYFAKRIHDAIAGFGTNDKVLIRILISRDEIDMPQIKQCYSQLYGKDMMGAIRSDTSGDYRKILMELAGH